MVYSGPFAAPPVGYMFIDGANLATIMEQFSVRFADGRSFTPRWASLRQDHRKVYYHDAVPVQNSDEGNGDYSTRITPKLAQLHEIEQQPGFHVRSGDLRRHNRKRGNEKKMVDVQLAVDALLMASRGLFDKATILTSDLDFKPLLDALVEMGVDVHLRYPRRETNADLIAAADAAYPIAAHDIIGWIDPVEIPFEVPRATHNFRQPLPTEGVLATLLDDRHGSSVVIRADNGFKLITEKSPSNPATHNLELWAHNQAMLRTWSEDVYNINIPEWD